jgi:hypothetical protein
MSREVPPTYEYVFKTLWTLDILVIQRPVFFGRQVHEFCGDGTPSGGLYEQ